MSEAKFSGRRVITRINKHGHSVIGVVLRRNDRIRQPASLKRSLFERMNPTRLASIRRGAHLIGCGGIVIFQAASAFA